jgi:hypothetical protein
VDREPKRVNRKQLAFTIHTNGFAAANGTIICNVGGGNVARGVYRIVSYAHDHSSIAKFKKKLLHSPEEEEVTRKR